MSVITLVSSRRASRASSALGALALALTAGCGDDGGGSTTADTSTTDTSITDTTTTSGDTQTSTPDTADTQVAAEVDAHDPNDPCHYVFDSPLCFLDELALGSMAAEQVGGAPADHCCFDYDNDGAPDNHIAEIVRLVEELPGIDDTINAVLASRIADGTISVLVEGQDITSFAAASDATFNAFYGDPVDGGGFTVRLSSFVPDTATPRISFDGVVVTNGNFFAGPGTFHLSIPLAPGLVLEADMEQARFEGTVAADPEGGMTIAGKAGEPGARLGGYIREEQLFANFNAFADVQCGCLQMDGALLTKTGDTWACASGVGTSGCDEDNDVERQCVTLVEICDLALAFITPDIATTPGGKADAYSVGFWVGGQGATVSGVQPDVCQ